MDKLQGATLIALARARKRIQAAEKTRRSEVAAARMQLLTTMRGERGLPGRDGKDGVGIVGPPGVRGESIVGPPGPAGRDGRDGQDGKSIVGPKGDKGDPGLPGRDGKDGESIVGPRGERGLPGKDGVDGKIGAMGERGPRGERGEKGDRGREIVDKAWRDGHLWLLFNDGFELDLGQLKETIGGRSSTVLGAISVGTKQNVKVVSADYQIKENDDIILVSAAAMVTLPSIRTKKPFRIKRTGSGDVTVQPQGSATIDGVVNKVINLQYYSVDVHSDGTNWIIL